MTISFAEIRLEGAPLVLCRVQLAFAGWQAFSIMVAALALGIGIVPARAQDLGGLAYDVTYIEVMPKAQGQAAALLKTQAAEMRKQPGNMGYAALQRDNPSRHFAIVECWKDRQSLEAGHASDAYKEFRNVLTPLLSAPYDERPHMAMLTDPRRTQTALSAAEPGAVLVVTHVDNIPTKLEEGIAATKALFTPSAAEAGNLGYDILQQASRLNHMTLFEIWKDGQALEAHETSDFVRHYRQTQLPMSGSLYDQRTYHVLN